MKTKVRAAAYVRVSTADQHNEIQVRELRDYIKRRGWALAEIYDDQMTGAKSKRPGLDRLMQDARRRRFDAVVVWKLDRFGRSLVHCVSGIQELVSLGVRFVAISQGIDTDDGNPASKLLMHILACVAEFEHELIRERVSAGMRHARAEGRRLGRPPVVVNRQRVADLRAAKKSYREIARELSLKLPTVHRIARELGAA
jgi:DNA invertase Pin-like site-specific DNA recombinase